MSPFLNGPVERTVGLHKIFSELSYVYVVFHQGLELSSVYGALTCSSAIPRCAQPRASHSLLQSRAFGAPRLVKESEASLTKTNVYTELRYGFRILFVNTQSMRLLVVDHQF